MPLGEQALPVRSELAELVKITTRSFSRARVCTGSATEVVPTSKMAATPLSYQPRAMAAPTSGLFRWSPCSTSIGRPSTLPPKSSTAIVMEAMVPKPE